MKNKIKDPELFRQIREFLTSYLPVVKRKSEHTITAYKDALNLYFLFLNQNKQTVLSEVYSKDFNQTNILEFMTWLQEKRGNEVTTINQRLSHIRGFCKYLLKKDILTIVLYEEICDISEINDTRIPEFIWLAAEDIKLILEQPDIRKKTGVRDRFFLALMYESGCRNDEILHLKVKDLIINKNGEPDMHIFGKGNKHRCTPISANIVPYYKKYCELYHPEITKSQNEFLFYTTRNGIKTRMSPDNVQRFMKIYEDKVKKSNEAIPHLHPHLFRRTRAMHLYIAGIPLPLISEWLGHSDEETTRIYARATDEMKRQAQHKLGEALNSTLTEEIIFKYADNDEIIKKLSGLK